MYKCLRIVAHSASTVSVHTFTDASEKAYAATIIVGMTMKEEQTLKTSGESQRGVLDS